MYYELPTPPASLLAETVNMLNESLPTAPRRCYVRQRTSRTQNVKPVSGRNQTKME